MILNYDPEITQTPLNLTQIIGEPVFVVHPAAPWVDQYNFRWDALSATVDYYSTLMDEWDD